MSALRLSILPRCGLVACVALAFLAPPASAQLGGFIKRKVAERVADRADRKLDEVAPASGPGTALSADQLDRVLASLETSVAARARADSLDRLRGAISSRIREIDGGSREPFEAYDAARLKQAQCRADFAGRQKQLDDDPKRAAAAQKLTALITRDQQTGARITQEFTTMQRAVADAVERGDRKAAIRLEAEFYRKYDIDVPRSYHEADAVTACGAPTPKPPIVAQRDSLHSRMRALDEQRRAAQTDAQEKARAASGLPASEYFQMTERVERWYAIAVRGERGPRFWTDEENALFEARRDRIEGIFRRTRG